MLISLNSEEIDQARQVAELRNQSQRQAGRADGRVMASSIQADLMGAEGELAVAKALNLPWDGKFLPISTWLEWKHEGNDVGNLEVRTTNYETGKLILHDSDKNFSPYLLVISSKRPEYRLAGWIFGHEGKKSHFWATQVPRPCYMIRQELLRSMEDLKKVISGQFLP